MRETGGDKKKSKEETRSSKGGEKNHSAQWHPCSIKLRPIPSLVHFSRLATPRLLLLLLGENRHQALCSQGTCRYKAARFSPRAPIRYLVYFPAGSRMHKSRKKEVPVLKKKKKKEERKKNKTNTQPAGLHKAQINVTHRTSMTSFPPSNQNKADTQIKWADSKQQGGKNLGCTYLHTYKYNLSLYDLARHRPD